MNLIKNRINYELIKEKKLTNSVTTERFIKTLDSKSYLSYLNKFVDQYNNTFHHSINKKTY